MPYALTNLISFHMLAIERSIRHLSKQFVMSLCLRCFVASVEIIKLTQGPFWLKELRLVVKFPIDNS